MISREWSGGPLPRDETFAVASRDDRSTNSLGSLALRGFTYALADVTFSSLRFLFFGVTCRFLLDSRAREYAYGITVRLRQRYRAKDLRSLRGRPISRGKCKSTWCAACISSDTSSRVYGQFRAAISRSSAFVIFHGYRDIRYRDISAGMHRGVLNINR